MQRAKLKSLTLSEFTNLGFVIQCTKLCLLNFVHVIIFFFFTFMSVANFTFVRCRTSQKHHLPVQRLRKNRCIWRRQKNVTMATSRFEHKVLH
jgi:hypothetical protein